jgi:acyl transferase domain-containing protein/NAD(P)-dependent dehydrogenase (short-subunit alcohol dehydrogenase family)/acyl carrier protein
MLRFTSTFTGDEFFFADHIKGGYKILSGAVYLEMARAAVFELIDDEITANGQIIIKNVVCHKPLIIKDIPVDLNIDIELSENNEILYKVYSCKQGCETIIHNQGIIEVRNIYDKEKIDLNEVISRNWIKKINAEECYDAFKNNGIEYGSEFSGIGEIFLNENESFSRLITDISKYDDFHQYLLHPTTLTSAIQTAIILSTNPSIYELPFSFCIDEVIIYSGCNTIMWSFSKLVETVDGKRIDILIFDNNGESAVSLKGLYLDKYYEMNDSDMIGSNEDINTDSQEPFEIMTFQEDWQKHPLLDDIQDYNNKTIICFLSNEENQKKIIDFVKSQELNIKFIFVVESQPGQNITKCDYNVEYDNPLSYIEILKKIKDKTGHVDAVVYLWPIENKECIREYFRILYLLQASEQSGLNPHQYILAGEINNEIDDCYIESWIGFERSTALIMPRTKIKCVFIEKSGNEFDRKIENWMKIILQELAVIDGPSVLYRNENRHICRIRQINIESGKEIIKNDGIYLITGGSGKLGFHIAQYLARRKGVTIILLGRTELNDDITNQLRMLSQEGCNAVYIAADVSSSTRMKEVYDEIKLRFGGLNGIIHAAGISGSQNILRNSIANFNNVVSPKIDGTIVLNEIFDDKLDFICYFSSSAGIIGDFGSCDYSIGNRFQMSYSRYKNRCDTNGNNHGKSFVINWPLWQDGGMNFNDKDTLEMYLKSSGQRCLSTDEGLSLFEKILMQDKTQVLVMVGQKSRMLGVLGLSHEFINTNRLNEKNINIGLQDTISENGYEDKIEMDIKRIICRLLKINEYQIDRDENFAEFGFNSINLAEFANELSVYYDLEITPSIFFSYSTIAKFANFLSNEHRQKMNKFYSAESINEKFDENKKIGLRKKIIQVSRKISKPKKYTDNSDLIAIIGMSGRFPEARNIDEMWQILVNGYEVIKPYPNKRLNEKRREKKEWRCGCIPGIDEFDPLFFEISPREAEIMDPKQRLLMQESWKALEDAGYGPKQIQRGKIGMFVGVEHGDYYDSSKLMITSNHNGILAARLAYFLGFKGPVMAIDTACSSGLVAVHQACLSLRNNECDTALASSVHLITNPVYFDIMNAAGILSESGKCYAFDKRADGIVAGEAVVSIVLKKLSIAEKDGDPIYAVIKGSGINYDGKTNGITSPSGIAQTELVRMVYDDNRINPEDIDYIIAHGTGTKLGDPVEINALNDAFKKYTNKKSYCAITSSKTNFGHTFAASGLVSLVSMVQSIKYKIIPASINFEEKNEYINWNNISFYINKEKKIWEKQNGKKHLGAISSFGISGTNVHMVIQEYQEKDNDFKLNNLPYFLIIISAFNPSSLEEKVKDMISLIENTNFNEKELERICYTLIEGRQHFSHRYAIITKNREELLDLLKNIRDGKKHPNIFSGNNKDFTNLVAIKHFMNELVVKYKSALSDTNDYIEMIKALAELYCQGYDVPWQRIYGEKKPQRLHLPTYPFAREKYWLSSEQPENEQELFIEKENASVKEKSILLKEWQRRELSSRSVKDAEGVIILLSTKNRLSLCSQLFKWNEKIKKVIVCEKNVSKEGVISTDYYNEESGEELYKEIKQQVCEERILGVIDLTSLDPKYEKSLEVESGKIVFLQRLLEHDRDEKYKLLQLTYRLNKFMLRRSNLCGARLAGLYRMLGSEYKMIESSTVDIDKILFGSQELTRQIESEFMSTNIRKLSESCYRGGLRYEPYLSCMYNEEELKEIESKKYKESDVVLISGGSRGIGSAIAGHIVNRGVKKLVIMGQAALPEQSRWSELILKSEDGVLREKLQSLQGYIDLGVRVLYYNVDLTDEKSLLSMVNEIKEKLGRITGVYHCAGVVSHDPAFYKKGSSEIKRVCVPKIKGLVTLHNVLKSEPLSYFIMFSSISGIIPSLSAGQSDYALANSYMDYYAMSESGRVSHVVKSLQWPSWWETGMSSGYQTIANKSSGFNPIKTETGLELLDICMNIKEPVQLPCEINRNIDLSCLLKKEIKVSVMQPDQEKRPSIQTNKKIVKKNQSVRVLSGNEKKEPGIKVKSWLKEMMMKELKLTLNQLEDSKPFSEYGVDSIIMAQMTGSMEKNLKIQLSPSLLLEYQTIESLSDYFEKNHVEKISAILNESSSLLLEELDGKEDGNEVSEEIEESCISLLNNPGDKEDIAVIGISCRFPGSPTKESYWELLSKGESAISRVPEDRWKIRGNIVDYGGWVEGINSFDPGYFNLTENDASIMDPQARVILEESLKAIYDAGYESKELSGKRVGVYVGGRSYPVSDIESVMKANNPILGIGQNYLATNISRTLNLTGASLVLDTACSSGLTAMSMSIDGLRNGRIEMGLVGAVNLILTPFTHEMFSSRKILSEEGAFHIFDKRSSGEVLGEGAGVVLLKRLGDAVRDGNKIYGIVKAISVNNDGRTLGPGSPNINAQKQVMRDGLKMSGKRLEEVGYIEVNGGGSPVTDSIELKGLNEVYDLSNKNLGECAVGSIKPNIGHLLLTSGLAGFIRCILSLHMKKIPPFLSAKEPAEYYDFESSRMLFNRQAIDWNVEKGKKRVAVQNSFPDGGTNCHVVMEEYINEEGYEQKYFSIPVPEMNKKIFYRKSVDLQYMGEEIEGRGRRIASLIDMYKKEKNSDIILISDNQTRSGENK